MAKKVDLEKIKRIRKNLNLSVEDMSESIGYRSMNGYYYLETGRNKFSAETLARVADIFNLSISDLFFEE
ncbi:helix-turn-helix transcriptional regulator [Bacillus sp. 105MF]|uniref:helix-turn-helix transcriptional regulator n=1 Tax=Bacillus sp. 105MF TaxID=1151120 RepID=UPI0003627588|nr:helix-turn-helix transcriptional regulator [Bacillus sp. 105MF]